MRTAFLAALLLLAPPFRAEPESGATLGGRLDLTDHHGRTWSLSMSRGKVVILSFGYTSCPDVCPITLSTVSSVLRDLGPRADEIRAVFVSLDPQRDTRRRLREYVRHFHPAIVGLSGNHQQLTQVSQAFNVSYRQRPADGAERYTLDHTANVYLLDAEGRVARIVPFGLPPDHLMAQVLELLPP